MSWGRAVRLWVIWLMNSDAISATCCEFPKGFEASLMMWRPPPGARCKIELDIYNIDCRERYGQKGHKIHLQILVKIHLRNAYSPAKMSWWLVHK